MIYSAVASLVRFKYLPEEAGDFVEEFGNAVLVADALFIYFFDIIFPVDRRNGICIRFLPRNARCALPTNGNLSA